MSEYALALTTEPDLEPVTKNPFEGAHTALETPIEADEALDRIAALEASIRDIESERDQFIEHYQAKIESAEQICENRTKYIRVEIDILTEKLRRYAINNLPDDRKSIKLPSGTLAFSHQSPQFFFDGLKPANGKSEQLIHFAKHSAREFLQVDYTESVDWRALKSKLEINEAGDVYFAETGEIIDGLHAQILPDKFKVTTK